MEEQKFNVQINTEVLKKEIIITNQEEFLQAGDVLKLCKDKVKEIDEERKSHTDPLEKEKKWWIAKAKEITKPLADYISRIETAMNEYHQANEAKRLEAEAKRQEELKQAEEQGVMPSRELMLGVEAEETKKTTGNVATTSMVENWEFEIENPSEITREYCSPDERLIRQAIKDGLREIKGVRIYKVFKPKSFKA